VSASKRPSTSSLRRFITSRPFVTVAELRRRFGLDDPDAMTRLARNGTVAWIGLPEREGAKLQDLWERSEVGIELSVDVQAPVVVGVYPMRIARYVVDGSSSNGHAGNRSAERHVETHNGGANSDGHDRVAEARRHTETNHEAGYHAADPARPHPRAPRPMSGAPSYGSQAGRFSASGETRGG
jgi:hypothetical protein